MRLKRVFVQQLFGLFDHDIKLHTDERITIIHGPNGVGKTTILRLIADLFNRKFESLARTPFKKLELYFDDDTVLSATKDKTDGSSDGEMPTLTLVKGKERQQHKMPKEQRKALHTRSFPLSAIDDLIGPLTRVGQEEWFDETTSETLSFQQVLYRYGDALPPPFRLQYDLPKWLNELLASVSLHFIQTQRLFVDVPSQRERMHGPKFQRTRSTVDRYAEEMAANLQETLRQSGTLGASLDRTFPQRLLEGSLSKKATEANIRHKYETQLKYRERLMAAGLIDPEKQVALPANALDKNERKVLWYYLGDIDKKLDVFADLLAKTELLKDIINSRFKYKKFFVDKAKGFIFLSNSNDKRNIPLNALSSGEQHELVLAYELLFKVPGKSMILIDEPELSLHVTWQRKFLDDIERISSLADIDFLIATHSPSIVHTRRHLMVPLGG